MEGAPRNKSSQAVAHNTELVHAKEYMGEVSYAPISASGASPIMLAITVHRVQGLA